MKITLILLLCMTAAESQRGMDPPKYPTPSRTMATTFQNVEAGTNLSEANTKFTLELYMKRATIDNDNIFISPLSISIALAMTYLGARGNTKDQMKTVLHFNDVQEDCLHEAFSDLQSALVTNNVKNSTDNFKNSTLYTLYMANRLFGQQNYTFLQEFQDLCQKYYRAELAALDFR